MFLKWKFYFPTGLFYAVTELSSASDGLRCRRGAPVHSDSTPLQVLFSEGICNKMVPYGDISAFNQSQSIPPQTKLAKLSLEGAAYLHKENWYPSPTILSWIWGLRLAMKGNTQVLAEHPVLRPPGTDNSTHWQVARQPRSRLTQPIRAELHYSV